MSDERRYIDYATVRDALQDAQERRGELSYEQNMALNHATWAASEARNGIETSTDVFDQLLAALMEMVHRHRCHCRVCSISARLVSTLSAGTIW